MIISTSKSFIFAAFQKTGSSSIEKALLQYGNSILKSYIRIRYRYGSGNKKEAFKHISPS